MARISRTFMDYGCYHVITRGNQKQNVFKEGGDCEYYLGILRKAKKKYGILVYAYCLMPNHAHMLVEVREARTMSKFMQWINRGYAAYFNARYEKVGHLWQGRFRSKPIIKGQYLIHCATYIESNPIRAKMASDIVEYQWSSYQERCLLSTKTILDEIKIESVTANMGTL